jgi:hypothetical protein
LVASLGEGALAHPGGEIPLLLPQFQGMHPSVLVAAELLKVGARRAVLLARGLLGEPERLFPLGYRGVGELRRKASEGHGIAGIERGLVLPEAPHRFGEVIRGAAAERLAHGLHGRALAGRHGVRSFPVQ